MKTRILIVSVAILLAAVAYAGEIQQRAGLGALEGLPVFDNDTAQGTTPAIVTIATPPTGQGGIVKVKITNPNATANLAWTIVNAGAAAPTAVTMTANFAATGASPVLAGSTEWFEIQTGRDLYIVASAAGSSFNVTSYLFAQ